MIAFFDKTTDDYNMRAIGPRFFDAPKDDAWLIGNCSTHFLHELYISKLEAK